jgi:hypothetical protein
LNKSLAKKYKMHPWLKLTFGKYWRNLNPKSRKVNDTTRKNVITFYERYDVSRMTAGKKETVTRKKIKKQRRFLLDTLTNLYLKFKSETNVFVSYSQFCKFRPFWVLRPKISDRETCL